MFLLAQEASKVQVEVCIEKDPYGLLSFCFLVFEEFYVFDVPHR